MDCEDGDCMASCSETDCSDGLDDEGDGYADCQDDECIGDAACDGGTWLWFDGGEGTIRKQNVRAGSSGGNFRSTAAKIDSASGRAVLQTSSTTYSCSWTANRVGMSRAGGTSYRTNSIWALSVSSTGACSGLLSDANFYRMSNSYGSGSGWFDLRFRAPQVYMDSYLILSGTLSGTTTSYTATGFGSRRTTSYDLSVLPTNPWFRP